LHPYQAATGFSNLGFDELVVKVAIKYEIEESRVFPFADNVYSLSYPAIRIIG